MRRAVTPKIVIIFALALVIVAGIGIWSWSGLRGREDGFGVFSSMAERELWDVARFERDSTDELMDLLQIREGMTIVDIGTATGQHAMKFAAMLNGTGRVFATDIEPELVEHLKRSAAARGLSNLTPVLVNGRGFDPFYEGGGYDLVTMFHCALAYGPRVDYFAPLRRSMKPGGRLVIMIMCAYEPFDPSDFTDLDGLIDDLSSEDTMDPLLAALRLRLQREREVHGQELSKARVADIIAEEVNGALQSVEFGSNFVDGDRFKEDVDFLPDEKRYADTLLLYVKGKRMWANGRYNHIVELLNRLLIVQSLRRYLRDDIHACNTEARRVVKLVATLRKAGYELLGMHDFIPFDLVLVFGVESS
jgi:SAM-dependent methyltransferase